MTTQATAISIHNGSAFICVKSAAGLCGYLGTVSKRATVALFAVGVDAVTLDHSIKCAAIDTEDLRRARAIAARDLEDVEQVATLELVERGEIFEERRQRRTRGGAHLGCLKFFRPVFGNNGV